MTQLQAGVYVEQLCKLAVDQDKQLTDSVSGDDQNDVPLCSPHTTV